MIVADIVFVLIGTSLAWWISGYDSRVTGAYPKEDFIRRAIRCGVTLVLLTMATLNGFIAIFIFLSLGIFWAGCGAEFFSQQIHKLIDPEDKREFDPKETERKLDLLAQLTRERRIDEALDLCEKLEKSGEGSPLALEATIHRLYQETLDSIATSEPLSEIRRLCELKQFDQAELQLKQLLAGQPKNWAAVLMLMRIYAGDMSQPEKALAFLQSANKSPLHQAFVKYARLSVTEWTAGANLPPIVANPILADVLSQPPPVPIVVEITVEELLKNGQLSTAVELLENDVRERPQNFDASLKLAEVYAVYCADHHRATKIIQKLEHSPAFTPEEIQLARAKLREWMTVRRS
jgi:tetratricopeptide (TPR) repeat protein